jgi:hypothetical protein
MAKETKKDWNKRNPVALALIMRAAKKGKHPNKRNQARKNACRGKVEV